MNYYIEVLKKYAVFEGRAPRAEFWYFFLFHFIISMVLSMVGISMDFPLLGNIYAFAVMLPYIGVAIRRMHDIGKSGWYMLIPIYNIILFATEGDHGENEYGDDPYGGEAVVDHLVD